jgi:hypothetical protein
MNRIKLFIFFIIIAINFSESLFASEKREYHLSNQMIINGQFEDGNTGFYTDYIFSPSNMRLEGTYCLSQNPKKQYSRFDSCSDKTNQSGFMLLVNSSDIPDKIVWKQTVRGVELNSVYLFSFWSASVNPANPPFFDVFINGTLMQPSPFYLPADVCKWSEIRYVWNSNNIDTAEIIIINRNIRKSGNDFVIDDISFSLYCSLTASAEKYVSTCKGEAVRLNVTASGGEPPLKYEWFPKTGLDNPYSPNPNALVDLNTTYIVKIVDSKLCEAYDTVRVNIFPEPKAVISSDKGFFICPCDSARLSGPPGMSYLWSTGETSQSIYINKTGNVSLKIVDKNGCTADTSVFIEMLDVSSTIELGTIEAAIGETFTLPISVKWSDTRVLCNFDFNSIGLVYNKSILQPVGVHSNRRIEGDLEFIELNGNNLEQFVKEVKFTAVLGKTECTPVEITHILYDCSEIKVSSINGQVCLKGICKEGGTRLVNTDARQFLTVNHNTYNDKIIIIKFGTIEKGSIELGIYDYLGRKQLINEMNELEPGSYEYQIDVSPLGSGLYYLILKTPTNIITQPLMLAR